MPLTPTALLLLHVQRHDLEGHPDERALLRDWAHRTLAAREHGDLIALVQWDGEDGAENAPFTRPWTLHPDLRAETGDLLLRARRPDAFAGTDLEAQLRARAVRDLFVLGLPGTPELDATARSATAAGFGVALLQETV